MVSMSLMISMVKEFAQTTNKLANRLNNGICVNQIELIIAMLLRPFTLEHKPMHAIAVNHPSRLNLIDKSRNGINMDWTGVPSTLTSKHSLISLSSNKMEHRGS